MILLISYDLNQHERPEAYSAVKRVIEKNANAFKKVLYSQWFVETGASVKQWESVLEKVIDANDRLLITRVRWEECEGILTKEIWEWLKGRT